MKAVVSVLSVSCQGMYEESSQLSSIIEKKNGDTLHVFLGGGRVPKSCLEMSVKSETRISHSTFCTFFSARYLTQLLGWFICIEMTDKCCFL